MDDNDHGLLYRYILCSCNKDKCFPKRVFKWRFYFHPNFTDIFLGTNVNSKDWLTYWSPWLNQLVWERFIVVWISFNCLIHSENKFHKNKKQHNLIHPKYTELHEHVTFVFKTPTFFCESDIFLSIAQRWRDQEVNAQQRVLSASSFSSTLIPFTLTSWNVWVYLTAYKEITFILQVFCTLTGFTFS